MVVLDVVSKSRLTTPTKLKLHSFFCVLMAGALTLFAADRAVADVVPTTEVYGTAPDGTVLHWVAFAPTTPGPWPAVLIIHGGNFYGGSPTGSPESVALAQDLAATGYIALSIEYRLAPPGALTGQVSDGRYPQQTDDVKMAVRAARVDSRCNGQVGVVGGSAGGYHAAFVAATGTPGDDRVDVAVSLSGLYDATDFSANPGLYNYSTDMLNYMGVPQTDTTTLKAASPAWLADNTIVPLMMVNSLEDSIPYSQLGDMIAHLDALGLTNYQTITVAGDTHSFDNYPLVKDQLLTFIADGFAGIAPPPPLPTPGPNDSTQKLLNVSTRANVLDGESVMVGGFIITGDVDKRVVLRGLGPSLSGSGVTGLLGNPYLELYDSAGVLVEANDNRQVLAGIPNALLPSSPLESYLTAVLPPGNYTAILHDADSGTGIGLVELYDVNPVNSRVANISTRGHVSGGESEMIGGFIIGGSDPTSVIVRALGPSLAAAGVSSPLPDPVLQLFDGNGNLLGTNDNWRSTQEQQIINTGVPPTNDLESAIVATLDPGHYTALVHDSQFRTGVALVEAYDLAPQ
jgi:acetyl esterase/lipase